MGKILDVMTGIVALICLAPWAVFLGGLARMTDKITDWDVEDVMKQHQIMLEWYIISSQFIYILVIAALAFARLLHRSHSVIVMFLAVNTTLLIVRATYRIDMINGFDETGTGDYLDLIEDPLPTLRAIAAGQIITAGVNFLLAVLAGLAGTDTRASKDGQPATAV